MVLKALQYIPQLFDVKIAEGQVCEFFEERPYKVDVYRCTDEKECPFPEEMGAGPAGDQQGLSKEDRLEDCDIPCSDSPVDRNSGQKGKRHLDGARKKHCQPYGGQKANIGRHEGSQ